MKKIHVASLWFGAGFSSPQLGVSLPSSVFPEPARASGRSAREETLRRGFPPPQQNPAGPANPRAALPGRRSGWSQRRKSPPTFTFLADATEATTWLGKRPSSGSESATQRPPRFSRSRLPLSLRSSLFPCGECPKSGWGTACCCRRCCICSAKGNHMATATASLRRAARELLTTLVVTRSSRRGAQRLSALPFDMPPATPITQKSYLNGPSDIPLISKTVDQCLEETTDRYPEREALVFLTEGIRKTFSQFKQDVDQAATGLLALGLKKGDRLGMWGPNNYEWVLMQFATAQAGIILVSVNPAYQSHEVEFVLKKVGCKALVFPAQFKTQKYYEILKNVCPELEHSNPGALKNKKLPELSVIICVDSKLPGTFSMQEVMQAGESSHKKKLQEIRKMLINKEPINIQFTSGTTGSPKGATLSHFNILNNASFIGIRMGLHELETRCCVPVPLYHCLGSVGGCMVMAVHGVSLIFPCLSFNSRASLKAIEHEKCTHVLGTPTMYIDMLGQPDFASYDLSSLRGGAIGGSTVPPEIMKKIIQKMNIQDIVGVYGTTENSPVTFMGFPQDTFAQKTETVGYILPHTEAKIEDPNTGQIVPLNSAGELQIRGYCVMLGYWADTNKTKEVLNDEQWYKTGDIAILDEYGYCKIVGRCKDMIIRGGENIYPAELEQFLHTHPKIQEVQVVGVKDERFGEEICASIRVKAGEECTADEIKAFCKGKIAHFKIPRYVVFVKDYPLTVSGKIQKYKLRERMEKHLQLQ